MSKGNPFLALRLSTETLDLLREASNRRGVSISDMAREALVVGLMANPATAAAAAALTAAVTQDIRRVARRRSQKRKPSRIQRASAVTEELRQLLADYEDWRTNQPEFAANSATADKVDASIEALEAAIDALEELDLPRGYGRD